MIELCSGVAASDRDAILARRLLLLGAALSGITASPGAWAQGEVELAEPEPCDPARTPSPEELERARESYKAGLVALEMEQYAEAEAAFRRALELSAKPRVIVAIARVAMAREDFVEARRLYRRFLACGQEADREVETALAKLQERIAHVTLTSLPEGARVEVDGKPIADPRARFDVNPGPHVLRVIGPDGREMENRLELISGEDLQLSISDFPPDCDRQPALCMPCLSPPPPPPAIRSSFLGVEAGGSLWLDTVSDDSRGRVGHGVRAVPFLALPLGRQVSLRLGAIGAAAWTPDGDFFPLGGDAQIAIGSSWWQMGLGLSGGWVLTSAERSRSESYGPRPGPFVEPYVQALGLRLFEPISVGLRVGSHLSEQANVREEHFGWSYVNVGLWLSVALTGDCDEWPGEGGCWSRGLLDQE